MKLLYTYNPYQVHFEMVLSPLIPNHPLQTSFETQGYPLCWDIMCLKPHLTTVHVHPLNHIIAETPPTPAFLCAQFEHVALCFLVSVSEGLPICMFVLSHWTTLQNPYLSFSPWSTKFDIFCMSSIHWSSVAWIFNQLTFLIKYSCQSSLMHYILFPCSSIVPYLKSTTP